MKLKNLLMSSIAMFFAITSFAQPTTNPASLPTLSASQVISIYTDNFYSDLSNVNFNPGWGQSGFGTATTFTLSGNNMRHYPNMNYQGIDIKNGGANPPQNVSSLDTLHLDVYTTNCTSLDVFLVNDAAVEKFVNRTLTLNAWNRLKIPLSAYASQGMSLTAIKEFKFVGTPFGTSNVYIDNIFFYTTSILPTLSNFPNITKNEGDPNFTVAAPTSNNNPATFTYTSSNTSVATINPTTGLVTLVGPPGTSDITATQPASNGYSQGMITATLTVSPAVPTVAATTPTRTPASAIISVFSDAYTPTATMTTAPWSGNTTSVVQIAGNNTLRASTLNNTDPFVGFDLSSALNLTNMTHMHLDIYISGIINIGSVLIPKLSQHNMFPGGSEVAAYLHTISDPMAFQRGQWKGLDIPFTAFNNNLTSSPRDIIAQLIFSFNNLSIGGPIYFDNIYFYNQNLLPVDFKSFEISKNNSGIQLQWTVGTEVNVNEYIVEKSLNGRDFSAIGSVTAKGTDKYNFTDGKLQNGTSYYRIKSVDKDGSFKYTAIKSINHVSPGKLDYTIYPNPVKGNLFIKDLSGSNNISILDATGKVVYRSSNVTNASMSIDLSKFSSGLYTVLVNNGAESKAHKIFVEK
jgi:hypothetical protein